MNATAVRRCLAVMLFVMAIVSARPASAESCNPYCDGGLHGGQSHVWPTGGEGYGGHDVAGYTGVGGGVGDARYGGGGYGIAGVGGCGGNSNVRGSHVNGSACP